MNVPNFEEYRQKYQQQVEQRNRPKINDYYNKNSQYAAIYSPEVMQEYSAKRKNGLTTAPIINGQQQQTSSLEQLSDMLRKISGVFIKPKSDTTYGEIRDYINNLGISALKFSPVDENGYLTQDANKALDEYDSINPYSGYDPQQYRNPIVNIGQASTYSPQQTAITKKLNKNNANSGQVSQTLGNQNSILDFSDPEILRQLVSLYSAAQLQNNPLMRK